MKLLLLLLLFCVLVAPAAADYDCDWHAANDGLPPDFAHYDAEHDSDGDGIGCETITGLSEAELGLLLGSLPGETVVFHTPLIELDETGSYIEEAPPTAAQALDDAPAVSNAQPVPAVPSVRLRVNSNFRAAPGLQFAIVGGGAMGSVYEWTTAQLGPAGYIWYRLALPGGAGWVRGDLVDVLDPDDIAQNPSTTPNSS